ncbi:MAG: response regulator transcription factor [Tissierellia bacterium]|nr:response regulator transcription factor [Tissierellia bacterium]
MLIYIVEDDASIQKLVEYALSSKGYETKGFEKGKDFFAEIEKTIPDLVILDIMLPDIDGVTILKEIKKDSRFSELPVMMLTAKNTEYDIVSSLDLGADDYMKKPFSVLELVSRVNALLRRNKSEKSDVLDFEGIVMDLQKRVVTVDDNKIELTFKEFELLKYLMENIDIVFTREKLLNEVWDYGYEGETRTVDMHINLLRGKLKDKRKFIHTVRGVGYKLSSRGAYEEEDN